MVKCGKNFSYRREGKGLAEKKPRSFLSPVFLFVTRRDRNKKKLN